MNKHKNERELLEKILSIVEEGRQAVSIHQAELYDNKSLMKVLGVSDSYLCTLRDNGHIGFSRHGDKYWYTREDVNRFLEKYHFDAIASGDILPGQNGKIYG